MWKDQISEINTICHISLTVAQQVHFPSLRSSLDISNIFGTASLNLTMTSTLPLNTYTDPDYERAHQTTFAPPKSRPVEPVLPPGVKQAQFDEALKQFASAVGTEQVFIKEALAHYIDPYEVCENDASQRKMPSAAVW